MKKKTDEEILKQESEVEVKKKIVDECKTKMPRTAKEIKERFKKDKK